MIFIIGGTGKVGKELIVELSLRKIKARVLVRNAQKAQEIQQWGHEPIQGDFTHPASFEASLAGIEKLFLLTTSATPENWAKDEISLIKSAQKAGIKKVILLSAIGSRLDSPIALSREHAQVEEYLKKSALAYTILQPGGFMQNFLNLIPTIRQGAIYGNYKDGKTSFIDARDIAAVAVRVLTEEGHDGQTYVLTGGETLSYADVASKLSRVIGRSIKYVDVPTETLVQGMTKNGIPEWLARDLSKMGEAVASGHAGRTTEVVENVTHRKPITLDEFFENYASVFKS